MMPLAKRFLKEVKKNKKVPINWLYRMNPQDLLSILASASAWWGWAAETKRTAEQEIFCVAGNACHHALMALIDGQMRPFMPGDRLEPKNGKVVIRPKGRKPVVVKGAHKVFLLTYVYRGRWAVAFDDIEDRKGRMFGFPAEKFKKIR